MFADRFNEISTVDGLPWRLQELADTRRSLYYNDQWPAPTFGRRYSVFYNQVAIGLLEIHGSLGYDKRNDWDVSNYGGEFSACSTSSFRHGLSFPNVGCRKYWLRECRPETFLSKRFA